MVVCDLLTCLLLNHRQSSNFSGTWSIYDTIFYPKVNCIQFTVEGKAPLSKCLVEIGASIDKVEDIAMLLMLVLTLTTNLYSHLLSFLEIFNLININMNIHIIGVLLMRTRLH